MFKKTMITLFIIFILTFQTTFSFQKAQASGFSFASIPGYADEAYASIVAGALTVSAAGLHAQEYIQDNLQKVYDGAKSAYQTLAPEAKANFIDSLNAAGDRISVAGDWITHALDSLKSNEMKEEFTGIKFSDDVINNSAVFSRTSLGEVKITPKTNYTLVLTRNNNVFNYTNSFIVRYNSQLSSDPAYQYFKIAVGTNYASKSKISEAEINTYKDRFNNLSSVAEVVSFISEFGFALGLNYKGVPMQGDESIYSQLDKRLRETDLPAGVLDNIVFPSVEPWAKTTNERLRYDGTVGGLTLDGVNAYTGDITWRTTKDAGFVFPAPGLTIGGVPVYRLGDGTIVGQDGKVIPNISLGDITVTAPNIEWVEGVPHIRTVTNVLINIHTGEVVGEEEIPKEEEEPVPGEFSKPTVAINWAPLKMNGEALTKKFPFSIPWDFITQLKVFAVAPQAPKFEINIPHYFSVEGQSQSMNWTLDFKDFDAIGTMFRWFILIVFDVGLILAIRKLLPE